VLAVGATLATSSRASFNGQGNNAGNLYAFTALYAPSALTASPSGHNVNLSWTAGTNGSGYAVLGVANGNSSNCSAVTYASVGTSASTTYTDTGRYTPQGTYFCYQAKTTYQSWTSVNSNPTAVAQIGVVATSVVIANGSPSTAGTLGPGDTITVNFNQPITTASGPTAANDVCWTSTGTVVLATIAVTGTCSATEANNLGKLSGGATSAAARYNATYAWSNGNATVKVTVGSTKVIGSTATSSGTFTFNPTTTAADLLSATGAFHACDTNTGGGNCLPTVTGGF
jgi:hypothetical protein